MARGLRLSMPAVDPILDRTEKGLIERALAVLRKNRPRDSAALWAQLKRVALLGMAIDEAPSLVVPAMFGGAKADEATLLDELTHLDPYSADLKLPEKAVVARAFLFNKIALLRGFLTIFQGEEEDFELAESFRAELAQSIYTVIATEILVSLLVEGGLPHDIKLRAAQQVVLIWERAALVEIDDFCPILEAAWCARSRTSARFGTLLATSEYIRLLQEDCPSEFLDYFTADSTADAERQAFEEFLFDLTHEELGQLRAVMRSEGKSAVDATFVARVIHRVPLQVAPGGDDPDALFSSYRRRRAAAMCRRLVGSDGPPRVAEAYVMIHLLGASSRSG